MKKNVYLFIILIIFLSSLSSALLLLFYMNVETNVTIGLAMMGTAVFLALSSFFAFCIYFFKRIYYRGEVYTSTIHSSLRQAILLVSGLLTAVVFYSLGVLNIKTIGLLVVIVVLFELMIESIGEN